MKYAFVSSIYKHPEGFLKLGGPFWCAHSIEKMLQRHGSDLDYEIVKSNFKEFFSKTDRLVHIQFNNKLIEQSIDCDLPIIIGPNVVWQKATDKIVNYPNIKRVLTLRPDPAPRKRSAPLQNIISHFPPFTDEEFFVPTKEKKTIDVLTIGKSFPYSQFERSHRQLISQIQQHNIKHVHLAKFNHKEFRKALNKTKLLLYPSPKESAAGVCHVLLEANMMNVPFVGLSSVVKTRKEEYHESRGFIADSIDDLGKNLSRYIEKADKKQPRDWTVEHYSYKAGFDKLMKILHLC